MIFWFIGGAFLTHFIWRIYKSADDLAFYIFVFCYVLLTLSIRETSPFLVYASLYLPIIFPYMLIALSALLYYIILYIKQRVFMAKDFRLNAYFISILSLHFGLLICSVLIGWENVLIAYATLPIFICCACYLLYRFLLYFSEIENRKIYWLLVTFGGCVSAIFIVISSTFLLPFINLIRLIL